MLTLSGRVKETQQVLATQFSFRLRTPDLFIKVSQTIQPENSTAKEIKISVWIRFLCFVFLLSRSQSGMPWSGRRCQWRSRLLTHSHRCWRRSNSTWRDWAFRLLTQFIMGEEANQTSCCALFFFLTTLYILCDYHCHFLSPPQRYWQPRLRVSDRALRPHPARAEEITGFAELQAAHTGSRCGRHPRGGQKRRRLIADSKPDAPRHWKIISLPCYLYGNIWGKRAETDITFYILWNSDINNLRVFAA